jgi:hypothetical protein
LVAFSSARTSHRNVFEELTKNGISGKIKLSIDLFDKIKTEDRLKRILVFVQVYKEEKKWKNYLVKRILEIEEVRHSGGVKMFHSLQF